jgi:hypothetical protein
MLVNNKFVKINNFKININKRIFSQIIIRHITYPLKTNNFRFNSFYIFVFSFNL